MIGSKVIKQLKDITGKNGILCSPEDLAVYSYDGTFAEHRPDVVLLPENEEQISRIVALAGRERIPVVTRGMGSGLSAASVPFGRGIVLSLTRMNRILEIDEQNGTASVEAGVVTAELQKEVERRGLFYPPDPSSNRQSTIGGNIACNSGGPRCLKYGVTGDYILGLIVVLADGRILRMGKKVIKDVVGYDLIGLFTGSEGTLGVITQALVKLIARPLFVRAACAEFSSLDDASRTVNDILSTGITPVALEIMDKTAIVCIEEAMHPGLSKDAEAVLLIETDGSDEAAVLREIETASGICRKNGAHNVKVAENEAQRTDLWSARRCVSPSLARKAPNKLGEDITVPRGAIPEAIKRIRGISARYDIPIVIFGHAGDGNLHPNILFDNRDPSQRKKAKSVAGEIFETALALGGTLSGEHGVGVLKRPYMEKALGPLSVEMQRRIKQAFDPLNIMNPGKVLPDR